jgi:hypothetical protein
MYPDGLWYRVAGTPAARFRQYSVRRYCMDEGGRRCTIIFHSPVAGTGNLSPPGQRHTKSYASPIR